jgi:predicted amidophosphoribosyltransferase
MVTALPVAFPDCARCAQRAVGPAALCLSCARRRMQMPGPDSCPVCSQRVPAGGRCANGICLSPRRQISRIRAIGYQSGPLRQAINEYKYRGARQWAVIFGRLLLGWLDEVMTGDPPGLIIANPSFVGPGGQLFAHTEAVLTAAAGAARAARPGDGQPWPFDTQSPAAIVKIAPTLKSADQQAWCKHATATELSEVLRVPDPGRTAGRFILVYDDICTTGSQLDAVAGCLLDRGGAARVEAVVLARAPWRRMRAEENNGQGN